MAIPSLLLWRLCWYFLFDMLVFDMLAARRSVLQSHPLRHIAAGTTWAPDVQSHVSPICTHERDMLFYLCSTGLTLNGPTCQIPQGDVSWIPNFKPLLWTLHNQTGNPRLWVPCTVLHQSQASEAVGKWFMKQIVDILQVFPMPYQSIELTFFGLHVLPLARLLSMFLLLEVGFWLNSGSLLNCGRVI